MNPPDPLTGQFVAEGAKLVIKHAEQFIAAAIGNPGEELGTILGTAFNRRVKNLHEIGSKAHFTLLNIGVQPGPVPLKVIQPMIEGASLEEDPNLQDKWANLMANAADPRRKYDISPLFQTILRELSPRDAIFLDAINARWIKEAFIPENTWTFAEQDLVEAFQDAGLGRLEPPVVNPGEKPERVNILEASYIEANEQYELSKDILVRTAILRLVPENEPLPAAAMGDVVPAGDHEIYVFTRTTYVYTGFGIRFMKACQPPPKTIG